MIMIRDIIFPVHSQKFICSLASEHMNELMTQLVMNGENCFPDQF